MGSFRAKLCRRRHAYCILKVPCATLGDNTERSETVGVGSNVLVGTKPDRMLDKQMTFYFANYNFCRGHGSLKYEDENGCCRKNSPAKEQGLIDRNWTLRELLTYPHYITSTG